MNLFCPFLLLVLCDFNQGKKGGNRKEKREKRGKTKRMVLLSVLDKAKDMASRLLPTPYLELVEEATEPCLSTPKLSAVTLLCDNANTRAESVADVVRAVRRRIANSDPTVQYLTVIVLESLVKNCNTKLHTEVAAQKGIVKELYNIATRSATSEKECLAKEAALALILNFSVWFAGHPNSRLKFLTSVAEAVRRAVGPNAFDGIQPDIDTRLSMAVGPTGQRTRPPAKQPNKSIHHPPETGLPPGAHVVDAIGIVLPTDEELGTMLDVCMTLAEYLNDIKVNEDGSVEMDDVIESILSSIRSSNKLILLILGSDLKPSNREMLVDVCNSQNNLMQRLSKRAPSQDTRQGGTTAQSTSDSLSGASAAATAKTPSASSKMTAASAAKPSAPPETPKEQPVKLLGASQTVKRPVKPTGGESAAHPQNPLDLLDDLFPAAPAQAPAAAPPAVEAVGKGAENNCEDMYSSEEVSEERNRKPVKHVYTDFEDLLARQAPK